MVGYFVLLKGNLSPQNFIDSSNRRINAVPISFLSENNVLPFYDNDFLGSTVNASYYKYFNKLCPERRLNILVTILSLVLKNLKI